VNEFFNDEFIDEQVESDFNSIMLLLEKNEPGNIFCPFRKFYLGPKYIRISFAREVMWSDNVTSFIPRSEIASIIF